MGQMGKAGLIGEKVSADGNWGASHCTIHLFTASLSKNARILARGRWGDQTGQERLAEYERRSKRHQPGGLYRGNLGIRPGIPSVSGTCLLLPGTWFGRGSGFGGIIPRRCYVAPPDCAGSTEEAILDSGGNSVAAAHPGIDRDILRFEAVHRNLVYCA